MESLSGCKEQLLKKNGNRTGFNCSSVKPFIPAGRNLRQIVWKVILPTSVHLFKIRFLTFVHGLSAIVYRAHFSLSFFVIKFEYHVASGLLPDYFAHLRRVEWKKFLSELNSSCPQRLRLDRVPNKRF